MKKHPGGRPSLYDPKYVDMMDEYFDIETGYEVEVENSRGVMQSVRHAANLPTIAGFACKIGVTRETLHDWATKTDEEGKLRYPEFSYAYKRAKDHQERILVENALKGGYQANFAIFTAKNVIGWRDKHEHEHTGDFKIEVIRFTDAPAS